MSDLTKQRLAEHFSDIDGMAQLLEKIYERSQYCYSKTDVSQLEQRSRGEGVKFRWDNGVAFNLRERRENDKEQYGYIHIGEIFGEDATSKSHESLFAPERSRQPFELPVRFTFSEAVSQQLKTDNVSESIIQALQLLDGQYASSVNNFFAKVEKHIEPKLVKRYQTRYRRIILKHLNTPAVENLLHNLTLYRDKTVNIHLEKGHHHGYNRMGNCLKDLNGALIYYAKYNDHYYLCPAAIGRQIFHHRLKDLLRTFRPCSNIDKLCDACALFGLAGRGEAAASRVRFTDAHRTKKEQHSTLPDALYDTPQILKELASPKLSATEFYLQKPPRNSHNKQGADLWNYDYALRWQRRNGKTNNRNPELFCSYKPQIRGRKFYWHHQNPPQAYVTEEDLKTQPESASERNVHVRPLKEGTFSFKVYFNNITQEELYTLLWVLEIGGSDDHAHKIGMGKPIGLGSIQIRVETLVTRTFKSENTAIRYDLSRTEPPHYPDISGQSEAIKEFRTITYLKHPYKDKVSYPYNDDAAETYQWFVANRRITARTGGTGTSPVIHQPLKDVEDPEMVSYTEV